MVLSVSTEVLLKIVAYSDSGSVLSKKIKPRGAVAAVVRMKMDNPARYSSHNSSQLFGAFLDTTPCYVHDFFQIQKTDLKGDRLKKVKRKTEISRSLGR